MRRRVKVFWAIALGLTAGCGDGKLEAPRVELPAAGDTVATNFSSVTDAVWLGGDRWAVIAPSNEAVGIADFSGRRYHHNLSGWRHSVRGRLGTSPNLALDARRPVGALGSDV
jgi:hypothetical protein